MKVVPHYGHDDAWPSTDKGIILKRTEVERGVPTAFAFIPNNSNSVLGQRAKVPNS